MRQWAQWSVVCLALSACGDNIHPEDPTPARIETRITPDPVTAGDTATARCIVYSTENEVIEDADPTLVITPVDPGTTITGLEAVLTHAGHYAAQCTLPGIGGSFAQFDVVHALPAKLVIGKMPDQPVYPLDVAIAITHAVADRYDNPIDDAVVTTASTPVTGLGPTAVLSPDSYSYGGEGRYRIDATVMPPTDHMQPVTASLEIIVNQSGPVISCGSPMDGAMLNLPAGSTLNVTGSAVDVNGTMDVTVDGTPVQVAMDGSFTAPITSRFGINFVDVVATDEFGAQTTKVCTFLAASQWANPASLYSDTVALGLAQGAIDDGARSGPITSLGDMLYNVENSTGIRDAVDQALLAANPLKPMSCDQQLCLPFVGCTCLLSSEVDYQSSAISGPNTDSLGLVNGGIAAQAQINSVHITLRVHGSAAGIGYDTTGPVDIAYIRVNLTLDTTLVGTQPKVTVRPGSVSTSVGTITTNFSGIDGFIINLIVTLANGTVRNLVANQVTSFVTSKFNSVLDGVIGGLHVDSLGTSFSVPRLDGSGTVPLAFNVGISTLSTTSSRMLFGLGTRFSAATANAYPTLGVPVPAGTVLADPSFNGATTAVGAHVAIFNQALHALWKANFFNATIDGSTLNANATGITIGVTTRLPPVASFDGTNVQLSLGDLDLAVSGGSIPAPGLALTLGARAHTGVALAGNDLQFSGIVVDEVHVSSETVDWNAMNQQMIQDLLKSLAQQLADQSLNSSLPSLPIPSFPVTGLTTYGIPNGNLRITNPALAVTPPHFLLRGGIGIQ